MVCLRRIAAALLPEIRVSIPDEDFPPTVHRLHFGDRLLVDRCFLRNDGGYPIRPGHIESVLAYRQYVESYELYAAHSAIAQQNVVTEHAAIRCIYLVVQRMNRDFREYVLIRRAQQ